MVTHPLFSNIKIVLVRAENPANIGQAARAMKNFGLWRLALVNCAPHQVREAYTLGWNAKDILDRAQAFRSSAPLSVRCDKRRGNGPLALALEDSVLSVGFTRRSGHSRGEPRSFLEILPQVMEAACDGTVSLLFGNEKNGLSNEELHACHLSAILPTSPGFGSLNLSHAVAIAGFLIFSQTPESVLQLRKPERYYATQGELESLMADFGRLLEALDYRDTLWNDLLTRTLNNLRRLFKKAGVERREYHLFKALLSRIEQRLGAGTGSPVPVPTEPVP